MKKTISLLLVLTMLLGLAACGEGGTTPTPTPDGASDPRNIYSEGEWTFEAGAIALPEGFITATAQACVGGRIYIGGYGDAPMLASMSLDGDSEQLAVPEGYEFIYALDETADGIAVLAGSYPAAYYDADWNMIENPAPQGELSLLRYGADGQLSEEIALEGRYPDENFRMLLETDEGFILLSSRMMVKIGVDGRELGRLNSEDLYYTSMCEYDGEIILCLNDMSSFSTKLCALNVEAFTLGEPLVLEGSVVSGLGVSDDGRLLISEQFGDAPGLRYLDLETGETELIFRWQEDLSMSMQNFRTITAVHDVYLFFATYQEEVTVVKRVFRSGNRTELVLAADFAEAELYTMVNKFNAESEDYKITVKEYYGDENGGMDMLRTEIIAGKAPDLYAFGLANSFADVKSETYYADLYPFIDADADLGRDTLISSLQTAMEENGSLYFMPYAFSIYSFTAPESLVGSPGITMAEAAAIVAKEGGGMQIFPGWMDKPTLLGWVCNFAMGIFVDRENGACSFDSPAFVSILEEIKNNASAIVGLGGGGVEFNENNLFRLGVVQSIENVAVNIASYGGDFCYVGFPNDAGSNGAMFSPQLKFAISAASEHKDGAWEFIKSVLSAESQAAATFMPATQSELNRRIDALVSDGGLDLYGTFYDFNRAYADKLYELIDNTTVVQGADTTIYGIIEEEATAYFADACTAGDAAAQIQSRVSLYLAETQ